MYKISTELAPLAKRIGEAEGIRMLAAAGFECYDFP